MNPLTSKTKSLTDQQKSFISAMLGPAQGDPVVAGEIAGYARGYCFSAAKVLKDELIEAAKDVLALHGVKAAFALTDALDSDKIKSETKIKLAAAREILDRVGVHKNDGSNINMEAGSTLFLSPEKRKLEDG